LVEASTKKENEDKKTITFEKAKYNDAKDNKVES